MFVYMVESVGGFVKTVYVKSDFWGVSNEELLDFKCWWLHNGGLLTMFHCEYRKCVEVFPI